MELRYLFPFEHVKKGSRVVIYGLGVCGSEYIQQIEYSGYCKIVAISDAYATKSNFPYKYISAEKLNELSDYDYVVVAITKKNMAEEAISYLRKIGINGKKIVGAFCRENGLTISEPPKCEQENLTVLFTMAGGFGDAIMELCLYERLLEFEPNVVIDVYGEPYSKYIYSTKANVRRIIDYNVEKVSLGQYDIALQASWGITIQKFNEDRVRERSMGLLECIKRTQYDMRTAGSLITRIRKAQILHKDKFWLMGRGDIWNLDRNKIKVDIDPAYKKEYEQLQLGNYITINCGVDMRRIKEGQRPTKSWPREHFEKFIIMFKQEFPHIHIVQLGDSNQVKMEGVDYAVFGKSFELVKYIAKESLLHIDDEGGLVHLATAFGTKCIVLFGPTPMDILGYPQNINICANSCPGCFAYVNDWNANCMWDGHFSKCMYDIGPKIVYDAAKNYLKEKINA